MKAVLIIVLIVGCGAKPIKDEKPAEVACAEVNYAPQTDQQLHCALRKGDPAKPIILTEGKRFQFEGSFHRPVIIAGEFEDAVNRPVLVTAQWVSSAPVTLRHLDLETENFAVLGDVELENVQIDSDAMTVEGQVRFTNTVTTSKTVRLFGVDVVIDDGDFLSDGGTVEIAAKSGQISNTRFEHKVTVSHIGATTQSLYLFDNHFSADLTTSGPRLFVERNCVPFPENIAENTFRNGNRFRGCDNIGVRWCSDELLDVPGFDAFRMKAGDFDGDDKDELIRISPTGWHLLQPEMKRWSYLGGDQSPPWIIGAGDFDGDGVDDLFKADGYAFWVAASAKLPWKKLMEHDAGFARQHLQIGDVNGDGIADAVLPGPGDVINVSLGAKQPFEQHDVDPGSPLNRWFAEGDLEPGLDWIWDDKKGKRWIYNFVTRKTEPFGDKVDPRSPGEREHVGKLFSGIGRCVYSDQSYTCAFQNSGNGGFSSAPGVKSIGLADLDGDGFQEVINNACGVADPCRFGDELTRVATYNTNHAGVRSVEEIAETIRDFHASLVVLQEIDVNTKRNPFDMGERIRKASGFKHAKFAKSNDYRGGDYGHLVLSHSPITGFEVLKLPDHDDQKAWSEHYIAIYFEVSGRSVIATHVINEKWRTGLDLSQTQFRQIDALAAWVKAKSPDLVMGDFNMKPTSKAYQSFMAQTGYEDAWKSTSDGLGITFPDLHGEPRRIDYVFTKESNAECALVPPAITSDHYPLVVGVR